MFTGIIQEVGKAVRITHIGKGRQLDFSCHAIGKDLEVGDSVCCNGVCLSVTELLSGGFRAFAVDETLSKSNLKGLKPGDLINLELALQPNSRLGGHYVTGHVDGEAVVSRVKKESNGSRELTVTVPGGHVRYCIQKGSVALNGVSLTIAAMRDDKLTVALIPITLEHTNLSLAAAGASLNLEVDMMGKYVEKLLDPYLPARGISKDSLQKLGYHA
ncbi:riboflavin synthase [Fibrobacterota bacterium]